MQGKSGGNASTPGSAGVMPVAASVSVSSISASKFAAAAAAANVQAPACYGSMQDPPVPAVPRSSHQPSSNAGASGTATPVPPAEWHKKAEAYRTARDTSVATRTAAKTRGSLEGAPDKETGEVNAGFREGSTFSAPATAGSTETATVAAVARAVASAAAELIQRLERMQREEKQWLHSSGSQKQ